MRKWLVNNTSVYFFSSPGLLEHDFMKKTAREKRWSARVSRLKCTRSPRPVDRGRPQCPVSYPDNNSASRLFPFAARSVVKSAGISTFEASQSQKISAVDSHAKPNSRAPSKCMGKWATAYLRTPGYPSGRLTMPQRDWPFIMFTVQTFQRILPLEESCQNSSRILVCGGTARHGCLASLTRGLRILCLLHHELARWNCSPHRFMWPPCLPQQQLPRRSFAFPKIGSCPLPVSRLRVTVFVLKAVRLMLWRRLRPQLH